MVLGDDDGTISTFKYHLPRRLLLRMLMASREEDEEKVLAAVLTATTIGHDIIEAPFRSALRMYSPAVIIPSRICSAT